MKYKILALDLDGTTFQKLGHVVEENIEPINKAIKTKTKIIFITGRPLNTKKNDLDKFDYGDETAIFVAFNGALIYDIKNKQVIDENPIDKEIVKKAFEILISNQKYQDVEMWAYSVDKTISYINKPMSQGKYFFDEAIFFDYDPIVYSSNLEITNCYKIYVMNPSDEIIEQLKEIGLEPAWTKGSKGSEVTRKGINKKYALEYIAKKFSINKEEILAIGDGANDIPMLEYAGLSIAPANANEEVKQKAKEVSEFTNEQGAVAKAINKYILGE